MKKQAYRHGEIILVKIDKLPDGLKQEKTTLLAQGKTGNSHKFKGGKIYFKNVNSYVYGYLEAKNTSLYHIEHSPKYEAVIEDGIYELRKQQEWVNGDLKQVID